MWKPSSDARMRQTGPSENDEIAFCENGHLTVADATLHKSKYKTYLVVSKIFYVHPDLGKWSNLTNMFQMSWNQQLENTFPIKYRLKLD